MLRFGTRLGVAVSGGADSVFLLHILNELGLAAAILHVNHQLRGSESEADARFVETLATRYNLPLLLESAPVPEGNVEQEARRQRYSFFLRTLPEFHSVATGHTLDDQAETVAYRFLRGSGTAGLSGIRPVTDTRLVRPLLDLRREDIRAYLLANSIPWREDSSNANLDFDRNRLRHQVMPLLGNPEILANTADWAQAEEDYWQNEIGRLAADRIHFDKETAILRNKTVLELPLAVQRRLLRRAAELVKGNLRGIDFLHIEAVRALLSTAEGSGRVQIPGLDIMRSFDRLRFAKLGHDAKLARNYEVPVTVPGLTALNERGFILRLEPVTNGRVYNKQVNALDAELCAGPLLLRNWLPGDHLLPHGHNHPIKIKTLFQDFRVPLWERRGWPVIALPVGNSEAIVWTRQFGASAEFAAHPATKRGLIVSEEAVSEQVTESKRVFPASMQVKSAPNVNPKLDIPRLDSPGAEVL